MNTPGGNAELEAARMLLDRLGISPAQLMGTNVPPAPMPTFDEYIERIAPAVSDGTCRAYTSYWNRIRLRWGNRRLDEPTPLEITELAQRFKSSVVQWRNSRGGRSAAEHTISALRCVYSYAVADGLITEAANPSTRVAKPHRLASNRHALKETQLGEIIRIATTTATIPNWTPCCFGYTSRQPAGAAEPSPYVAKISTRNCA